MDIYRGPFLIYDAEIEKMMMIIIYPFFLFWGGSADHLPCFFTVVCFLFFLSFFFSPLPPLFRLISSLLHLHSYPTVAYDLSSDMNMNM